MHILGTDAKPIQIRRRGSTGQGLRHIRKDRTPGMSDSKIFNSITSFISHLICPTLVILPTEKANQAVVDAKCLTSHARRRDETAEIRGRRMLLSEVNCRVPRPSMVYFPISVRGPDIGKIFSNPYVRAGHGMWSACGGIEKRLETRLTSYKDITNPLFSLFIHDSIPLYLKQQDVGLEPPPTDDSG